MIIFWTFIHRYIELDTEKSLVWNLQELELVENPTIAIVHKHHSGFFVEGKSDSCFIPIQIFAFDVVNFYSKLQSLRVFHQLHINFQSFETTMNFGWDNIFSDRFSIVEYPKRKKRL